MSILEEISEFLQKGKRKNVKALIEQALEEGIDPKIILKEGLMSGMSIIGGKFKREEVFVPDVMMAARAMNVGLSILDVYKRQGAKSSSRIQRVSGIIRIRGKRQSNIFKFFCGICISDGTNRSADGIKRYLERIFAGER